MLLSERIELLEQKVDGLSKIVEQLVLIIGTIQGGFKDSTNTSTVPNPARKKT